MRVPGTRETTISHRAQKIIGLVETPAVAAVLREASSPAEAFGQLGNDVARIDGVVAFSGVFKPRDQKAGELTQGSSVITARMGGRLRAHLIGLRSVIWSAALPLLA